MVDVVRGNGGGDVMVLDQDGKACRVKAVVLVGADGIISGLADAATETTQLAVLASLNTTANALPHQPLDAASDLLRAYARVTSASDSDVVAAVASQSVRVYRIFGTLSGAGSVEFFDGAAGGTSLFKFEPGDKAVLDPGFWERGWFKTAAGNKLSMRTTGAITVALNVYYTQAV